MTYIRIFVLTLLTAFAATGVSAQGQFECETIGRSTLKDYWGRTYGSGSMSRISLAYNFPLGKNWGLGAYADYVIMDNSGESAAINDSRIINTGLSAIYRRPLSPRWSLLATVGAGVFAPADYVRLKSILGSGGAIFVCHINDNLDIGGGAGISNSYGVPMIMPMLYVNWRRNGRFSFNVDLSSRIRVGASMNVGQRLRLDLTAINISGVSAVRERDGESRIYSQLCIGSSLTPSLKLSESASVYVGIGGSWARSVSESDRTLKAFFKGFAEEHRSKDFLPALRLNAGIAWRF